MFDISSPIMQFLIIAYVYPVTELIIRYEIIFLHSMLAFSPIRYRSRLQLLSKTTGRLSPASL